MISQAIVALAGLYFLVLAAVSLFFPAAAGRFLLGFAGSASKHFLELFLRMVVGAAFIVHAPRMFASYVFICFGWLLVGTTTCLLFVPWRWHDRFTRQVVPRALRLLPLVGIVSLAMGAFVLAAAFGAVPFQEPASKGSPAPGRLADREVPSENPPTIEPVKLHGIAAWETFTDGQSVYRHQA